MKFRSLFVTAVAIMLSATMSCHKATDRSSSSSANDQIKQGRKIGFNATKKNRGTRTGDPSGAPIGGDPNYRPTNGGSNTTGGASNNADTGGLFGPTPIQNITNASQPYTDPADIPGGAGGPMTAGLQGSYIDTTTISTSDVGYGVQPTRPAQNLTTNATDLSQHPTVNVNMTDIVATNPEHGGSAGVVMVSTLENGTVVVAKTYYPAPRPDGVPITNAEIEGYMLQEANSARMLAEMGIGAPYHGVTTGADGRPYVVMGMVTGGFDHPPGLQALKDMETIMGRLADQGIEKLGDFQPFVTTDDHMVVIDPGGISDAPRNGDAATLGTSPEYVRARVAQLIYADPAVTNEYLDYIQLFDPTLYGEMMTAINDRAQQGRGPFQDVLNQRNGNSNGP